MRISKARLIGPAGNEVYAATAVALSFFVFAYSFRFGQVSILAYYALWLPLVAVDYRRVLGNYARYLWIFAFALIACLSVFWSQTTWERYCTAARAVAPGACDQKTDRQAMRAKAKIQR